MSRFRFFGSVAGRRGMPARRCVSWEPFAADTRRAGEGVRPSLFPAQVPRQRHHLLVERPDV